MRIQFLALLLAACIPACHMERVTKSNLDQTLSQRISIGKADMEDTSRKSPFEKAFTAMGKNGQDKGSMFGKKQFNTSSFMGNKSFSGMKSYKSKEFAQSGKGSRYDSQTSRYAAQNNRYANSTYAAKDSALGGEVATQGGETYRDASATFGTGDYRDGKKSQQKNSRPVIIEGELNPGAKTNYTEAEIRQMVNR